MFEEIYRRSLDVDQSIVNRLGFLLTGYKIESELPDLNKLIPQPLIPDHCDSPKHCRISSLQIDTELLAEWRDIVSLLHIINNDRIQLRNLNFELIALISKGTIPNSDYQMFINRTQLLHYDLLKHSLVKERDKTEKFLKEIAEKNKIIENLEKEISNFSKKPSFGVFDKEKHRLPLENLYTGQYFSENYTDTNASSCSSVNTSMSIDSFGFDEKVNNKKTSCTRQLQKSGAQTSRISYKPSTRSKMSMPQPPKSFKHK